MYGVLVHRGGMVCPDRPGVWSPACQAGWPLAALLVLFLSNSFGQMSVWCWIRCSLRGVDSVAATLGPILALYLISVVMIFVVVIIK